MTIFYCLCLMFSGFGIGFISAEARQRKKAITNIANLDVALLDAVCSTASSASAAYYARDTKKFIQCHIDLLDVVHNKTMDVMNKT